MTTGRVTRSETSTDILGFSSGSIFEFKEHLTPEDRRSYERAIEAAAEAGSYEVEYPFQREPGTVAWLREFGEVQVNEQGRPVRVRGLATDITQRKLAETALRESEARYRLLADHATDMILRNDLSGKRTYVSPACHDVLGFEPEELLGTTLLDNVHPEDVEPVRDAFDRLRSGKEDQLKHTYRHRHKTGQWIWLEGSRRLVRDQNGEPAEVVTGRPRR